ncbi:dTDP-4-dehydrorhamnose reductase family protein [Paenibacillus sp. 1001270B_150601_E10]|uniref:dTDP-4-dehydrorhamnose reductase family protein n=1 Tax=Paenibacillus sp. 1001270B_150601_E10 TaxID=2787079 RepID=UPI0018A0C7C2|nr:SDR family oxidoreductase [Paenibacillus sp. 1001270B_150601_E10]
MKLLILGGSGMAGHMLVRYFRRHREHAVFYTSRDAGDDHAIMLDARDTEQLDRVIEVIRPQVIINAMGILNEAAEKDPVEAFQVNSLLPHRLKLRANLIDAKVIHISTDCVFLGDKGSYREEDPPDGQSMYAITKSLGELKDHPVHLTIRTSIIGPEIRSNGIGLLEWFQQQTGQIPGYKQVWWNGVTTLELAKAIHYYMDRSVPGLIHLTAPSKLSKHELLVLLAEVLGREDVTIVPQEKPILDRTLWNTRADADYPMPDYPVMLREMAEWMGRL